jgi:hypothetical protein
MFVFIYNCQLFGQLSISSLGTSYTIDFDNTVSGINSGQFTGTGFQSSPSSGQIDSDGIIATGFSSSLSFGGTGTSGDFARGADDGAVTTGGLYAFLVSSSNYGLGVQPGGSDFTPGTIVMKISNGTGSTITSLFVSYKVYVYNDKNRANSFNFSHSADNSSYESISNLDLTSTATAAGTPSWSASTKTVVVPVSISNSSVYYLKWTGDDVSGSGSRDEFALDDVVIYASSGAVISGDDGFRMMSSPVAGQIYGDLLDELWTQGMTGSDAGTNGGLANVWVLNGYSGTQDWTALTDISGSGASLTAGTGFLVYVFADTDWDGTADLPVSLSVSGSENSGSATISSIAVTKYALAGNPYLTTIDWDDIITESNNLSTTISVWDDAGGTDPDVTDDAGWKTYNSNGGSGDLTGGLIAPYQGFWIQASGGTGSITIETADKSNSSGTFYRTLDDDNRGRMVFKASSDGHSSSNYLSFYEGGTIGSDNGESELLLPFQASSRVVMMSVVDGDAHKISSYPYDHDGTISVPFDVMRLILDETSYVTDASEVTLNWDIEELPDHISMTLTDNITGSETYLDYESEYVFTTEPKGSFSATYDGPIGTYPVVGEPRFTLSVTYGALGQNEDATLPSDFALNPIYPNPFNPSATISFDIPDVSLVALNVYDVKGALVETLLQENMKPGKHHYNWEPQVLSSGVYFMKLTTANKSFTQKVTYIK